MFEREERIGVIIYLYYNRDVRKLSRYGDVLYHSRKMKYIDLYVPKKNIDQLLLDLVALKFVKTFRLSAMDQIDTKFVGNLFEKND